MDAGSGNDRHLGGLPQTRRELRRLFAARPRLPHGVFAKPEDIPADDYRRSAAPRFQGENFARNLELVEKVKQLAAAKGATASQVALAWVLAQGEDIIPIPGTKRRKYLDENIAALDLTLSAADLAALDRIFSPDAAAGLRYPESFIGSVNA
jgi:aryl-alcohol dehydrogenase-like predicted oxidoreductase